MTSRALGLGLLLLFACGDDDAGAGGELDTAEHEQATPVDCRPVRFADCYDAWNDRACFYLPPGCATRAPEPKPEPMP